MNDATGAPKTLDRVRILIATTEGPVEIEAIVDLDPGDSSIVALGQGEDVVIGLIESYRNFVARGSGIIAKNFGHSAFRLELSDRIDAGESWQLAVFIAHALHRQGRLAEKGESASTLILATGRVDYYLRVEPVHNLSDKIARSRERLRFERERGTAVHSFWPAANRSDVGEATRAEFAALGIRIRETAQVGEVLATLGLLGPGAQAKPSDARDQAPETSIQTTEISTGPVSVSPVRTSVSASRSRRIDRRRLSFATSLLSVGIIAGAFLLVYRPWPVASVLRHSGFGSQTSPRRAEIRDRNGTVLARAVMIPSIYADPSRIRDPSAVATELIKIFPDWDQRSLTARLSLPKRFVWIARWPSQAQIDAVKQSMLPGLDLRLEEGRNYPEGPLMSHIVGFAGFDNVGLYGIENGENARLNQSHDPLVLTADVRLQAVLKNQLRAAMAATQANGVAGVVVDIATGAILALVSLPDFEPSDALGGRISPSQLFNRPARGVYGIGEFYDLYLAALVLDKGVAPNLINRDFSSSDVAEKGESTPGKQRDLFHLASKDGVVPLYDYVSPSQQKEFLIRLELLQRPALEIPETTIPLVPLHLENGASEASDFGRDVAVSGVQMATALGALVSGGVLHRPTLLQSTASTQPGQRVVSEKTSAALRTLLGNSPFAGVWHKTVNGSVSDKHIVAAAFAYVPANTPRYVTYILFDDPSPSDSDGLLNEIRQKAAQTAGKIMELAGPLLRKRS